MSNSFGNFTDTETHYVVSINIKKVSRVVKTRDFDTVTSPREKSTLANVTVSARNIEDLRKKVIAHVDLIDDGGDIE